MDTWLFFLFFAAIAVGYGLGRYGRLAKRKRHLEKLGSDYARGINFLLNDQPDRAVDVLTKCLVVDEHTLETHLSLARVFRRRGELDRATRIHQNLLDNDALSASARDDVMLELALDYQSGGVLDRAEALLQDMVEKGSRKRFIAMRSLLQIFEQEKDWQSALSTGKQLLAHNRKMSSVLAHYCCELAQLQLQQAQYRAAGRALKRALRFDRQCARAWLLTGKVEAEAGHYKLAQSAYLTLYTLDGALFDAFLGEIEAVYRQHHGETEWLRFLADACVKQPTTARVLRLVSGLEQYYGEAEAAHLLAEYMKENPSVQGLRRYIDLTFDDAAEPLQEYLYLVRRSTHVLPDNDRVHLCNNCGFQAKQMHWQCPSCKRWGSIRPTNDIAPEPLTTDNHAIPSKQ